MKVTTIRTAKTKLNSFGNLASPPAGWIQIENMRSKWAKAARNKGAALAVVVGWKGNRRRGFKPQLRWYCHPKFFVKTEPVDAAVKEMMRQKQQEQQRRRAQKLWKLHQEALETEIVERNIRIEIANVLRRAHPEWAMIAIDNFRDVNEAHPEWLCDVLDAIQSNYENSNRRHRTVMWRWRHSADDLDFYECARMALRAWQRHTFTDYDNIDKRDMDEDEVDFLRQQKTSEGREAAKGQFTHNETQSSSPPDSALNGSLIQ